MMAHHLLLGYICVNKVHMVTLSRGFLKTTMYWAFLKMVLAYFPLRKHVLKKVEDGDVKMVGILSEQIQDGLPLLA